MGAAAAQARLRAGWDRPEFQGGRATRARLGVFGTIPFSQPARFVGQDWIGAGRDGRGGGAGEAASGMGSA